jgi:pyruvyltransferase
MAGRDSGSGAVDPRAARCLVRGAIRLYSWRGVPNLGDSVSARIVAGLSGRRIIAVERNDRRKLLACGSVAHRARSGDVVWGAGTIEPDRPPESRDVDVRAVRGPRTRAILLRAGIPCPEVYGDPALLLPAVIPWRRSAPRSRLAIVPHYQDKPRVRGDDPAVRAIDSRVLDIQGEIEGFLEELLACERVLSSSLHGLVFAEAYGIPAHELRIGDDVRGAEHKFRDYYEGTGRERPEPLSLATIAREPEWIPPALDPAFAASFPFRPA